MNRFAFEEYVFFGGDSRLVRAMAPLFQPLRVLFPDESAAQTTYQGLLGDLSALSMMKGIDKPITETVRDILFGVTADPDICRISQNLFLVLGPDASAGYIAGVVRTALWDHYVPKAE